jgi:hypothetical protein
MTPKEKAEELIVKFLPLLFGAKLLYKKSDYFKAKKCALIAVDELIYETQFEVPNVRQRYWIEVKQEIEKL